MPQKNGQFQIRMCLKFDKDIHSKERKKLMNINLRTTDVNKDCCWIGKLVTPEKLSTI